MERQTRSKTIKVLEGVTYTEREEEELIYSPRLIDGKWIIERMMGLCRSKTGKKQVTTQEASNAIAKQVYHDWIRKNVYPENEQSVGKKIKTDYAAFKNYTKQSNSPAHKKTEGWYTKVNEFNGRMSKYAYNIRTNNTSYQQNLEQIHGVKMTEEDENFFKDNCFGDYKATCNTTVSSSWRKHKKRKDQREKSARCKEEEINNERGLEIEEKQSQYNASLSKNDNEDVLSSEEDDPFALNEESYDTPAKTSNISTRSNTSIISNESEVDIAFPKVKIRESFRKMNEKVMRCVVQCFSDYKVSANDLAGIVVRIANMIFDQQWELSDEGDEDDDSWDEKRNVGEKDDSCENEGSENQIPSEEQFTDEDASSKPKRRKLLNNYTYVFPSRRSLSRYLEDASFLNLHMLADIMLNKGENVVTVGLDDTKKAAGHKLYDIKADHITVKGPHQQRKSYTTGYAENISHSGADGATAYKCKLKVLAALTNSTLEELISNVDFWMTDRAGDCGTLLGYLGVSPEKNLKCSAHIILGIDHACDKVFRDIEQKIGVHKLLHVSAGEKVFTSPSNSTHTLAQIAIAKLLSPSHAAQSISLFNDYKNWMTSKGIKHDGFKGFVSNRFGRITEIAKEYLSRRQSIIEFFDATVDENANKLVLAVSTYIQNEWFLCCSEVYSMLGDDIILPLMNLLGIDDHDQEVYERSWNGVKKFFDDKIPELKVKRDESMKSNDGKNKLYGSVLSEALDTLERQLSQMKFFSQEDSSKDPKMKYAPLTNMGCEGEFAKIDNRISFSGGSTTVLTHSRKNVVSTDKLLISESFNETTEEEKLERWKWARRSDEVKAAKEIEKIFIENVKTSQKLAVIRKEQVKKQKVQKTLKVLEACKKHAGPITLGSLHLLNTLNEEELLLETSFLRATIAPNIRQKRRIKSVDSTKAFSYEKFTVGELRTGIKNVIKPEDDLSVDVDALLKSVI